MTAPDNAEAGRPPTKKPIRWDWIETQWQRGVLSNYQIANLHGQEFGREIAESSIRLRASQYGWQRDISEAVRRETRAKLAKGELRETARKTARDENAQNESQADVSSGIEAEESRLVDLASDAMVVLETAQRKRLARCGILADAMEAYAVANLPIDINGTPTLTYEPGELKDLMSAASSAVATRMRVITTERKIYGMDAISDIDNAITDLMEKLVAAEQAETS